MDPNARKKVRGTEQIHVRIQHDIPESARPVGMGRQSILRKTISNRHAKNRTGMIRETNGL